MSKTAWEHPFGVTVPQHNRQYPQCFGSLTHHGRDKLKKQLRDKLVHGASVHSNQVGVRPWFHGQELSYDELVRTTRGKGCIIRVIATRKRSKCAVEPDDSSSQSIDPQSELVPYTMEFVHDPGTENRDSIFGWHSINVARLTPSTLGSCLVMDSRGGNRLVRNTDVAEDTTQSVLRQMKFPGLSHAEKLRLVLAAEVLDFAGEEVPELCTILREFILQNRNSNETKDLIAVGSAIRKLVAYLPQEGLGCLADLLESGHRLRIPLEVELEVAKTVVRRLAINPPDCDDPEPLLGERLFEVARTYLNPRLLTREKYGATALNALLALLLLRSCRVTELIGVVRIAKTEWFTQLACRRVARLQSEMKRRASAEEFATVSRSLVEFSERLCAKHS